MNTANVSLFTNDSFKETSTISPKISLLDGGFWVKKQVTFLADCICKDSLLFNWKNPIFKFLTKKGFGVTIKSNHTYVNFQTFLDAIKLSQESGNPFAPTVFWQRSFKQKNAQNWEVLDLSLENLSKLEDLSLVSYSLAGTKKVLVVIDGGLLEIEG